MPKQDFTHVTTWVFDLDNTLYPPHMRLFDQIEVKMTAWVMQALLSENYLHGDVVEVGCRQPDIPIYLAFAPGLADSARYARLFEQGLLRFREDGRMDELLRRYGLR